MSGRCLPRLTRVVIGVLGALLGTIGRAHGTEVPLALRAVVEAGELVGVDPLLLVAIAYEESALHPYALNLQGRPMFPGSLDEAREALRIDALTRSIDIGALQVNTQWIDRLNRRGPMQLGREALLDPAISATLGAAVLKTELDATGGDTWRAVARYHTGPERPDNRTRGQRYAAAVRRTYEALLHSVGAAR